MVMVIFIAEGKKKKREVEKAMNGNLTNLNYKLDKEIQSLKGVMIIA